MQWGGSGRLGGQAVITPHGLCWWLQIDAEGFDATVIQGAQQSLASGHIGVLSFEYHNVGVWKALRLQDVVATLDNIGYVW